MLAKIKIHAAMTIEMIKSLKLWQKMNGSKGLWEVLAAQGLYH